MTTEELEALLAREEADIQRYQKYLTRGAALALAKQKITIAEYNASRIRAELRARKENA